MPAIACMVPASAAPCHFGPPGGALKGQGNEAAMRLGILTGGGDAPGLNAAIRAVVMRATTHGDTVVGFRDGWAGLVGEGLARVGRVEDVQWIVGLGGP